MAPPLTLENTSRFELSPRVAFAPGLRMTPRKVREDAPPPPRCGHNTTAQLSGLFVLSTGCIAAAYLNAHSKPWLSVCEPGSSNGTSRFRCFTLLTMNLCHQNGELHRDKERFSVCWAQWVTALSPTIRRPGGLEFCPLLLHILQFGTDAQCFQGL
jgi:hypothetical protein